MATVRKAGGKRTHKPSNLKVPLLLVNSEALDKLYKALKGSYLDSTTLLLNPIGLFVVTEEQERIAYGHYVEALSRLENLTDRYY